MTVSRRSASRAASVARTTLKRRGKQYRTEQSRIFAKRRKLEIRTTYETENAPAGFRFLPVGTYDLAKLCIELSRKRAFPVTIVNAKPVTRNAKDPHRVSHHIHRIGYHFRDEVVDKACQDLGYMYAQGQYVSLETFKENYMLSMQVDGATRSDRHLSSSLRLETDDQVRAGIGELFPEMPESDIKEILKHAWKEGSERVGTRLDLPLSRRVQLATLARIRHAYTDYDQLLRAFDWKVARAQVEDACREKIMEWRGENDNDEDNNELEEIIREIIVIDDEDSDQDSSDINDDDDDDDYMAETDSGNVSDTSLEIIYDRVDNDVSRAESTERPIIQLVDRQQPRARNATFPAIDLRQNIHTRQPNPSEHAWTEPGSGPLEHQRNPTSHFQGQEVVHVDVTDDQRDDEMIMVGGQLYQKGRSTISSPHIPYQSPSRANPSYDQAKYLINSPADAFQQSHRSATAGNTPVYDRPMESIESFSSPPKAAAIREWDHAQNQPQTIDQRLPYSTYSGYSGKRRRLENFRNLVPLSQEPRSISYMHERTAVQNSADRIMQATDRDNMGSLIEASSNWLPVNSSRPAHTDLRDVHTAGLYYTDSPRSFHGHASLPRAEDTTMCGFARPQQSVRPPIWTSGHPSAYDTQVSRQTVRSSGEPINAQIAPIQYVPRSGAKSGHQPSVRYAQMAQRETQGDRLVPKPQSHRILYVEAPRATLTPQPSHGDPAPIQQIPRGVPTPGPRLLDPRSAAVSTGEHASYIVHHSAAPDLNPLVQYYSNTWPRGNG